MPSAHGSSLLRRARPSPSRAAPALGGDALLELCASLLEEVCRSFRSRREVAEVLPHQIDRVVRSRVVPISTAAIARPASMPAGRATRARTAGPGAPRGTQDRDRGPRAAQRRAPSPDDAEDAPDGLDSAGRLPWRVGRGASRYAIAPSAPSAASRKRSMSPAPKTVSAAVTRSGGRRPPPARGARYRPSQGAGCRAKRTSSPKPEPSPTSASTCSARYPVTT